MKQKMRLGIIGGGLMGREAASAFGRWFVLENFPAQAELVAVCDLQDKLLEWFQGVPTVKLFTSIIRNSCGLPEVDVVYVADAASICTERIPDSLRFRERPLAEKPFGIDLKAARTIHEAAKSPARFVRCSSGVSFSSRRLTCHPYCPIRQVLPHHGNPAPVSGTPATWTPPKPSPETPKQDQWRNRYKGRLPECMPSTFLFMPRLAKPLRVYAQLQKIYDSTARRQRRYGCLRYPDNAMLHTEVSINGEEVPMRLK